MFLKEIELLNFKCHGHLKVYFDCGEDKNEVRKTTFMLGENGTGKSALLKAIALVTSGSDALGFLLRDSDEWIKIGCSFCTISATITTAEKLERKISLKIKKGSSLSEIIRENEKSLKLIDNAIRKSDRNYFVAGYGASRKLNKGRQSISFEKSSSKSSSRISSIESLFNPSAALVSLSDWAMELDYKTEGNNFQIIEHTFNSFFIDGITFKRIDKKRGQLIFATKDGEVPLNQLSDGYQNVAAWVGDLMFHITNAFKDYHNPLSARGILLIDEIDLHLHPKWQRQLYSFLKTHLPNFQVIATTHSPLTVQQAGEGELYALKRQTDGISLVPFIGNPSQMLLHQILMSPVIGLSTDESLQVEDIKAKIRSSVLNAPISSTIKSQVKKRPVLNKQTLVQSNTINIRSNALLSEKDFTLLSQINKELKNKKATKNNTPPKAKTKSISKKSI